MAKIIMFGNQKGGIGKSTLSILTANALASPKFDYKVLVIDNDMQRSILSIRQYDEEIVDEEYEDFEFMSIFFKENLTPLRFEFQDIDSTYLAKMYNPKNQSAYDKFFSGKPLIIVDDIVTRNGDFLARMRMKDVEKVELYYDLKKLNKQYKLFGSNGVTKITTYDKIESLPVFEANNMITINGVQKAAAFPVFDPAQINNNRFQPFFSTFYRIRNQVFTIQI